VVVSFEIPGSECFRGCCGVGDVGGVVVNWR